MAERIRTIWVSHTRAIARETSDGADKSAKMSQTINNPIAAKTLVPTLVLLFLPKNWFDKDTLTHYGQRKRGHLDSADDPENWGKGLDYYLRY